MKLSALNHNGEPIDWWFAYKTPTLHPGAGTCAATGYEYAYIDSAMTEPQVSDKLMAHDGSLSWLQVEAALSAPGYIFYNDERPDGKPDNGELGHCKGVLAWDPVSGTGFWMLHSWPLYPHADGAVPVGDYGQTFLCVSVDSKTCGNIAKALYMAHQPQVYAFSLPETKTIGFNNGFQDLAGVPHSEKQKITVTLDMATSAGMPFKLIAKNRAWADDFWNDLVGPTLGVDLDVETWIRGPIAPTADAGGLHTTTDVKFVNLGPLGLHVAFPETCDHAKWAISNDPAQPWVCVGDINRMISQRKRGGGCIAFQHLALWSALKQSALVMAPAGMSREDAHAHIKKSHAKAA